MEHQMPSINRFIGSLCLALAVAGLGVAAAGAAEKTLTVYTYDSFVSDWGPGPKIKEAFEAECGCSLDFVALDSSIGILSRLRLEGSHGKADLVLGLDMSLVAEAKATGLFQPHDVLPPALQLPMDWTDDIFLPFDFGHFAFIYDSEKLADPPTSLRALVDAPEDLKILIQDPRTSTPGLGLMLWVRAVYGDDAPAAWQALSRKIVTVTKSWSEAYGLFLDGEAPMVLSYTTSPAYHMVVDGETRYRAAAFEEGHYLQIEVAAMVKAAREPALARQFLAFMLTPGFQAAIPTGNWMFPVIGLEEGLPEAFDTLVKPETSLQFDPDELRQAQKAWQEEWLGAMIR
jgi:thiamine transport system substrate-binding protein